jgi:hypothetical protein
MDRKRAKTMGQLLTCSVASLSCQRRPSWEVEIKTCSSHLWFHGLASGKSVHKISDRLWFADRSRLHLILNKNSRVHSLTKLIIWCFLRYKNSIFELSSMNLRTLSYHSTQSLVDWKSFNERKRNRVYINVKNRGVISADRYIQNPRSSPLTSSNPRTLVRRSPTAATTFRNVESDWMCEMPVIKNSSNHRFLLKVKPDSKLPSKFDSLFYIYIPSYERMLVYLRGLSGDRLRMFSKANHQTIWQEVCFWRPVGTVVRPQFIQIIKKSDTQPIHILPYLCNTLKLYYIPDYQWDTHSLW